MKKKQNKIDEVSIDELLSDEYFTGIPSVPQIPTYDAAPEFKPKSFPAPKPPKSHKMRNRIIASLVTVVIIGGIIASLFMSKTTFFKDENQTGNTAGNLMNGGLFSESDGTIYFANPYDNNTLYSMDGNLKNYKKLINDNVSYLNVAGKYIFFTKRNDQKKKASQSFLSFSSTGLYRINKKGQDMVRYYQDPTQTVTLHGNYLYYQQYDQEKGLRLSKIKIDKSHSDLLSEDAIAPYSIIKDRIYYSGYRSDHSLHVMDTSTGYDEKIFTGNCFNVIVSHNYIYYMDLENDYRLCRVTLDGKNPTVVVDAHISTYNISKDGNTIYYQVDDESKDNGLYEYDLASGKNKVLIKGNYCHLHLTTNYLFFEENDEQELYVMHLDDENVKELHVPVIKKTNRGF